MVDVPLVPKPVSAKSSEYIFWGRPVGTLDAFVPAPPSQRTVHPQQHGSHAGNTLQLRESDDDDGEWFNSLEATGTMALEEEKSIFQMRLRELEVRVSGMPDNSKLASRVTELENIIIKMQNHANVVANEQVQLTEQISSLERDLEAANNADASQKTGISRRREAIHHLTSETSSISSGMGSFAPVSLPVTPPRQFNSSPGRQYVMPQSAPDNLISLLSPLSQGTPAGSPLSESALSQLEASLVNSPLSSLSYHQMPRRVNSSSCTHSRVLSTSCLHHDSPRALPALDTAFGFRVSKYVIDEGLHTSVHDRLHEIERDIATEDWEAHLTTVVGIGLTHARSLARAMKRDRKLQ